MTVALVRQSTYVAGTQTTSHTLTLTGTPAAGNTLLYVADANAVATTVTGISGCGATWTKIGRLESGGANHVLEVWIGANCSGAAGPLTVSYAVNRAMVANVSEWSGLTGTFETPQTGTSGATASSTYTVPTVTPGDVGDLVITAVASAWANGTITNTDTPAAFTDLTVAGTASGGGYRVQSAYRIATAIAAHGRSIGTTAASLWAGLQVVLPTASPVVTVSGTIAATATPAVTALAGTLTVSGTIAATASPATVAVEAGSTVSGTIAATASPATVAAAGTAAVSGTAAGTATPAVAALAGTLTVSGTIAAVAKPGTARLLAPGEALGPRDYLQRVLSAHLPVTITLQPYARDIDPPTQTTLMLRIDDVVRHPDTPESVRLYRFTGILLASKEGEAGERELEDALEDVLWSVEQASELPQWTTATRAVWRETTPAFEIGIPAHYLITDPTATTE